MGLEKLVWAEEQGLVGFPTMRAETVGLTSLFRIYLGSEKTERFNELLEKNFNSVELICGNCNRLYSLDGSWCSDENYIDEKRFTCECGSDDLDILFDTKYKKGEEVINAPRVVCYSCGKKYDTIRQFRAKCKHDENILKAFAISNERKDIVFLYLLSFADPKIAKSPEYFNGMCGITSSKKFLDWLEKEKYMKQLKNVPVKSLIRTQSTYKMPKAQSHQIHWYKLNNKGIGFRNNLLSRLKELKEDFRSFVEQRRQELSDYIDVYTQKGRRVPFGQHIHSRLLPEIYKNDKEAFWGKL